MSFHRLAAQSLGVILVLSACGSSTPAPADAKTTPATAESAAEAKVRAAIATFLADPKKGRESTAIMNFVGESADVLVVFREAILSAEGSTTEIDQLMLVAFSAGNVRAQLDAGEKADAPLAGVRAMIEVYGKLKDNDASLKIPKFEDYVARQAKGTLEAHVAELAAR